MTLALSITSISVGFAYLLYTLLTARSRGMAGWALVCGLLAVVGLEVFDLAALLHPESWPLWKGWALVAEGVAIPAWLLFALSFASGGLRGLSPLQKILLALSPVFLLSALALSVEDFFFSPDFAEEKILFLGQSAYLFYIGLILFLTAILVQLERLIFSLPRQERWRVKFELVGAGALMAMYLVYYSQGLLHRTIDMNLLPARSVGLIVAVGLMAWSRLRQRGGTGGLVVAPNVAFRSVMLLAVSVYLIGLGLLGEGMRYLGDAFPRAVVLIFGLLGGVGVVLLLFSEEARRRIRVTLHKNFYRNKYDYRQQWLAFTRRLMGGRTEEELHRAVLEFYCETFCLRGAAFYLREGESYHAVASHEWSLPEMSFTSRDPLVRSFDAKGWVFAARDENPAVNAAHGEFLRAYNVSFVVPLLFEEQVEGFIVLGPPIHRGERFIFEDFDLMKMLASHAAGTVVSLRLTGQLSQARELAAIGKVSAFVLHDLKNLISSLAMTAENARDYMDDPDFQQDMLETLDGTVVKMKGLMTRLRTLEEKPELDLRTCDLLEIVTEGAKGVGSGQVRVVGSSVSAQVDPEEIRKVALNLVLNGLEASGGRGPIDIEVGESDRAFFRVTDRGCGMEEEFIRTRLFKPFETTKKKGFGIGLYQCRNVIEAHGGEIEVRSTPGEGAVFTVWLQGAETNETTSNGTQMNAEKL